MGPGKRETEKDKEHRQEGGREGEAGGVEDMKGVRRRADRD